MSASAATLRDTIIRLRRDNADLIAALRASNEELVRCREELSILHLPFLQRWRLRRLVARRARLADPLPLRLVKR